MTKSVLSFNADPTGSVNSTRAIQLAFDNLNTGDTLLFPPGIYKCSQIEFNTSGITIQGHGATILSDNLPNGKTGALLPDSRLFKSKEMIVKRNISLANNGITHVTKGTTSLTFNSSDIEEVQVDDIVQISTTKTDPLSNFYKLGSFKYVTNISSTTLTLNGEIENTLSLAHDNVLVTIYRPIKDITITGLKFQLTKDTKQTALTLTKAKNAMVKDCQFIGGGQSFVGAWVEGFNITVDNCYAEEFLDDNLNFGYGFYLSGHNLKAFNNTGIRCKHIIAGGNNDYRCTDFLYDGNVAYDPQTCGFDTHGSCEVVKMVNNRVFDLGKSFDVTAGFWLRGRNGELTGNKVFGATNKGINSTVAYQVHDCADRQIKIKDNQADNVKYGIQTNTLPVEATGFSFKGNTFTNVAVFGILAKTLNGSDITKNKMDTGHTGISVVGGDNLDIDNNQITYGNTSWGVGIILEAFEKRICKNIKLLNNTCVKGLHGSNTLRIKAGYDVVSIQGNISQGATINTSEATDMVTSVIVNNL